MKLTIPKPLAIILMTAFDILMCLVLPMIANAGTFGLLAAFVVAALLIWANISVFNWINRDPVRTKIKE